MTIKVCLHHVSYDEKPDKQEISNISKQIAKDRFSGSLRDIAETVGNEGRSFTPAIFSGDRRKADEMKEIQLFALDFDEGTTYEAVKTKADRYHLPIAFAYQTFSSSLKNPRFRAVFLNDFPVCNKRIADIMTSMLLRIFDDADRNCSDVSRLYLGGKGLIGEVREETINIVSLAEAFQRYLFENDSKKYIRNIQRFAQKNDISLVNGYLEIFCAHEDGKKGGFSVDDLYIYGSNAEIPPKMIEKYVIHTHYQSNVRRNYEEMEPVRVEMSELEKKCQLFKDFISSEHIHHNERFLLLTNMIHISGGRRRFLSVSEKKKYDKMEWRFYADYIKKQGYKPQSCDGNCPYASACNHHVNLVNTVRQKEKIRKLDAEEKFCPVGEVYQYITECLDNAIKAKTSGIYLIQAQTAIGKTEAYCHAVRNSGERFLIAVPTNQLKREVEKRLRLMGIDALVTLSLDEMALPEYVLAEAKRYYNLGLNEKVSLVLRRFMEENDPDDIRCRTAVNQCREYLSLNSKLGTKRHLITTHARLATLGEEIISGYTVIIDEDILATFFKNMKTVSIDSIKSAVQSVSCPGVMRKRLEEVMETEEGGYKKLSGTISFTNFSDEELEKMEIQDNVNGLAFASSCYKNEKEIIYFCPQYLPDRKYIVLSATCSPGLYQRYFKGRYIKCYEYRKAEYRGCLKQYSAYSMSRQNMKEKWEKYEKVFSELQKSHQVITFMEFENRFPGCGLHFGNTEGVDSLKGKDIAVIGTPHLNEFVYKLIGCHLGIEVNGDSLSVRRVEYHNYEFCIMTYKDAALRELQLYFISRELEQCIGRARLLRNDCTALVFSNFPCEQAELIQEDYLDTNPEKEPEVCSPDMAGE